jgi:hypothetical protein
VGSHWCRSKPERNDEFINVYRALYTISIHRPRSASATSIDYSAIRTRGCCRGTSFAAGERFLYPVRPMYALIARRFAKGLQSRSVNMDHAHVVFPVLKASPFIFVPPDQLCRFAVKDFAKRVMSRTCGHRCCKGSNRLFALSVRRAWRCFSPLRAPMTFPALSRLNWRNRIQHAMRAATPRDLAAVRAAAESMLTTPGLDAAAAIGGLRPGSAPASFVGADGFALALRRCPGGASCLPSRTYHGARAGAAHPDRARVRRRTRLARRSRSARDLHSDRRVVRFRIAARHSSPEFGGPDLTLPPLRFPRPA